MPDPTALRRVTNVDALATRRAPARIRRRRAVTLAAGVAATAVLLGVSLFVGVADITDPAGADFLWITRVPRTASLMLAGASMAMAGLVMQLMTQNRFVEPTTVGTTEWAGLGLLLAAVLAPSAGVVAKMLAAIACAFVGTLVFFAFLRRVSLKSSLIVPIVGIMFGAVISAVTAFIGPPGCGKSTFLRTLNRMNDTVTSARVTGDIRLDGENIYAREMDVVQLRARVGMVFQKPNPFPKSIYENVAYGPRIHGLARGRADLDRIVEESLVRAGLWSEVKDRLADSGTALSGGQQQRLCIARAIAVDPEVILMDEPCSALDPVATARIEELIHELRGRYAIVIVTHNMQQAARVSQRTALFHLGQFVEYGDTSDIFTNPREERTRDYITGRYG